MQDDGFNFLDEYIPATMPEVHNEDSLKTSFKPTVMSKKVRNKHDITAYIHAKSKTPQQPTHSFLHKLQNEKVQQCGETLQGSVLWGSHKLSSNSSLDTSQAFSSSDDVAVSRNELFGNALFNLVSGSSEADIADGSSY